MSHIHSTPDIVNAFHVRFNQAEQFKKGEFYSSVSLEQVQDLPLVNLSSGQVTAGTTTDGYKFMLFGSKIGAFLMVENNFGTISYRCSQEFYTSASLRGMFAAHGIMRTMAMMNRIFAIPDSYNPPAEIDKNDPAYKGGYEVGYSGKADDHNTYLETSKNGILWRRGYNDGVTAREADYKS